MAIYFYDKTEMAYAASKLQTQSTQAAIDFARGERDWR
jgi:hypothetical protein